MTPRDLQASIYPLFVQIDRHGNVVRDSDDAPEPLSGGAICAIVQDRAAAAGLDADDFGAHSLRVGFITEAFTDDKMSIAEVQDVSLHEDVNVLVRYRRLVNMHRDNPVRRMFAHARQEEEPVAQAPSPEDVLRTRSRRACSVRHATTSHLS